MRRLELHMWLVAWDRYSLAAVAVDYQLDMDQALLHKEGVLSIACAAKANGRTELFGVFYDELARPVNWVRLVSLAWACLV